WHDNADAALPDTNLNETMNPHMRRAAPAAAAQGPQQHDLNGLSRRELAKTAFGLAAVAFVFGSAACTSVADKIGPGEKFSTNPFTLGVASGWPGPDSVVLWTRLATSPWLPDGGLQPQPAPLRWEVAEDEKFTRIVRSGLVQALPVRAHAVHVKVSGLLPARWYWYRFIANPGSQGVASPAGRTRTGAGPTQPMNSLTVVAASCQHYERGHFAALRHLADESPDLVVFLGDYIYESNLARPPARRHWSPVPRDLAGYRLRYAQYRTDPDLQRAHAVAPWLLTWDDHEVENDYANETSQGLDPNFLQRRAAAYLAWFEHMPIDPGLLPSGPSMRIYEGFGFGDLASFQMLDCRQYRSPQACPKPGRGGSNVVQSCPAMYEASRTMLGAQQERWLAGQLRASRARWNLIGQSTLFSRFDSLPGPGERIWTDGWSGYPAAQQRLVDELRTSRVRNPVILGGDVHANYVADVKADFTHPGSPTVATEFCVTSITSSSMSQAKIDAALPDNPHIRLGEGSRRGYLWLEIKPQRCEARLRTISDPRDPQATVATRASFVVESDRPGAQRIG
ncbi:MAG: alkaline phosphatase D family protein, partial [Quisquiliibacterium sp.]